MQNTNLKLDIVRFGDAKKLNDMLRASWLATYVNEEYGITKEDFLPAFDLSDEEIKRRDENILQYPQNPGFWVVRNGDQIAGYIRVTKHFDGRGEIKGLYVHPDFFGKGVAQILMDAAMDYLKDCNELFVQCTAYNERATKFYEKYGFKVDVNIHTPKFKISNGKELPERTLVKIQN